MKREYVQPKVDIVNLASTASFLAGSTQETTPDEWAGDGNEGLEDDEGNTSADPWA